MTDSLPDLEGRPLSVRVSRLLSAVLLGVLLALGTAVGTASAAPVPGSAVLAQQTTAPGVEIPPAQTEADADKAKNKLVVGVVAVVLLGLVIYGNRVRSKRKKG
ncbi:hypothetical protein JOD54_000318 [Actinokineospora baliensis]|uniref:hypothetical protein n=1 Tax=Actinokineospora baliensis TaxID=547056 RepID=UPI0027DB293D|nr:hypothetical protein [Actinokineospora baliensis]MBM7770114.1 hypothetical protein [Actinokineospora baliensis]